MDSTPIKAPARAHRWQRILDDGRYTSVSEMATVEKLDRGDPGRILMLTLLAPDIVEAIMDGRQASELQFAGAAVRDGSSRAPRRQTARIGSSSAVMTGPRQLLGPPSGQLYA